MKKILSVILMIFMMFSMGIMAVACKDKFTGSSYNIDTSVNNSSDNNNSNALYSQLEFIAIQELGRRLSHEIKSTGTRWSSHIDPSNCRYTIGSIGKAEGSFFKYEVNGVCYLYDKYGSPALQYIDGSGGSIVAFKVWIAEDGYALLSFED